MTKECTAYWQKAAEDARLLHAQDQEQIADLKVQLAGATGCVLKCAKVAGEHPESWPA